MTDVDSPLARALRALQKFDETCPYTDCDRDLIMEAETFLGEHLGLECSGRACAYGEASHDGDTCPVHEWLVTSDYQDLYGGPHE